VFFCFFVFLFLTQARAIVPFDHTLLPAGPDLYYRTLEKLGEGCFGAVTKVVHLISKETFAMKHMDTRTIKGERMLNLLLALREIEVGGCIVFSHNQKGFQN
jgi:hypothetical protein